MSEKLTAMELSVSLDNWVERMKEITKYRAIERDRLLRFQEALEAAKEGLNWILHPQHDEPDAQTRHYCAMHRANEALEKIELILKAEEK